MTEEFTMADADDDGRIKREAGKQMASVAKRESPRLFEHFQKVCENRNRTPDKILGGIALRALENSDYAKRISREEIDMSVLEADQLRIEDVEFVTELFDRLGLEEDEDDPVMDMINKRLEAASGSPLDNFSLKDDGESNLDNQVLNRLERLEQKIEAANAQNQQSGSSSQGSGEMSTDELFDSVTSEESNEPEVEVEEVEQDLIASEHGVDEDE